MKKTHLINPIHQSSICFCPVVRSEGIPGMWSVVLRSATSSVLLNNTMLLTPSVIQRDSLGWLRETPGDTESPLHSPLINQTEVRSSSLHHSHCRVGENTGAGEFYCLFGFCSRKGIDVCFLCLWLSFSFRFFNKVIRDDSQTHTNLCPSLLSL